MANPTHFETEIGEQPAALDRQLRASRPAATAIAERIHAFGPKAVVVAARGSSDNAARYAQYVLGARHRLVVALAAPSLVTIYDAPPRLDGMLVMGISQSGQSPDVVAVIEAGRRQGALTVAITNEAGSPLARAAEHVLLLEAGAECAIAATKTYTAELMAVAMLSAALEGSSESWNELARVPRAVADALVARGAAANAADACRAAERLVVLGRGFNYATAFELALKVKETSYVLAEAYSFADFKHGPAALLEHRLPALVVCTGSRFAYEAASTFDLLDARGAASVAISDDPLLLGRAAHPVPLPEGVPEWLSPLVAIIAGQLFALALAQARGLDPDAPRGLSKVTQTR